MAVLSRRLIGPAAAPNNDTLAYTVPAGRTLVIRTVSVFNGDTVDRLWSMKINGTANPAIVQRFNVPIGFTVIDNTRWYLNPGDTLYVRLTNNAAASSTYSIFGALLIGEPV